MFVAVGASLTAVPVIALLPVVAGATPSDTEVAMLKLPLKSAAGLKVALSSSALTFAIAPLALHTPDAKVEVTPLMVLVVINPAAGLDSVKVAVTLALSISLTTM